MKQHGGFRLDQVDKKLACWVEDYKALSTVDDVSYLGRGRRWIDCGNEAVSVIRIENGKWVVGVDCVESWKGETAKFFDFWLTFEKLSKVGI